MVVMILFLERISDSDWRVLAPERANFCTKKSQIRARTVTGKSKLQNASQPHTGTRITITCAFEELLKVLMDTKHLV